MKSIFLVVFIVSTTACLKAQIPTVSSGTIKHFENFSSKFIDARNVDVWLPNNYNSNEKYAVLYMHDGQMLFDSIITWNNQEWKVDETITSLLEKKLIKKTIVVGIWNNGKYRHAEYFPEKPLQFLKNELRDSIIKNDLLNKPQSDNYLKFIVTELKPFIDSSFSTYTNAENTFIAGSSMGGLISMYAICEYPNVFSAAACLSTHWIGSYNNDYDAISTAFANYLNEHLPNPENHKIYFDHGTLTIDSYYKPHQVKIDEVMKNKGYTSKNWITKEFEGANHTENSWSKRLHIPFTFILKK